MTITLKGKVIVTAALPYANGEIHLGHVASTYLPADIFARYCRLKGHRLAFICATDNFGTPILIRAEQEGKTPEDYVSYWHEHDLEDFTDLGISFDLFHKTSSKENLELAQHFFLKLYGRGYIYRQAVLQPYCEKDGKFLPDRYVIGTCPYCRAPGQYSDGCERCGRTFQPGEVKDSRCAICGASPVTKESLHYFFRLSKFSGPIKEWLTENEELQPEIRNYVLSWIQEGLRDWDITRDIPWGVPIPLTEARGKVLYGWFDNHLCYISSTLAYLAREKTDGKSFWNSSRIYHFIGKDIVYHHYLFLTAMRLGVGGEYKLPDGIPTRGHLLLHGQKFSKSRGWYVSLREFLEAFPADYLRYYLASITPYSQSDVNFDWNDFMACINNELVANIGNFAHRALSFVSSRFGGIVPRPVRYDAVDKEFRARLEAIAFGVGEKLEGNELDRALKRIVEFSALCNQYFQHREPWASKDGRPTCLYLSTNAVGALAILLEPYLPFSMGRLWGQLNLKGSVHEQGWESASKLLLRPGHRIGKPEVLFTKITRSEIEGQIEKLSRASAQAA